MGEDWAEGAWPFTQEPWEGKILSSTMEKMEEDAAQEVVATVQYTAADEKREWEDSVRVDLKLNLTLVR